MTSNELCFSSTCKFNATAIIPKFFFHDLSFMFSFILSHPIYFLYFMFFSPYLFKFISFISPLFFTTTLLLLCIAATTFPPPKLGFIQTVVDKLRSRMNDVDEDSDVAFREFEDFEIYKMVFRDPPLIEDQSLVAEETVLKLEERLIEDSITAIEMPENETRLLAAASISGEVQCAAAVTKPEDERNSEKLFEQLDRFDDSTEAVAVQLPENGTRSPAAVTISGKHQNPAAVTKSEDDNKLEKLYEQLDLFEDTTEAVAVQLPENGTRSPVAVTISGKHQNPAAVTKPEDDRNLEKLFEQLDLFEDSTEAVAIQLPENEPRSPVAVTISGKHQNPAAVTKPEDERNLEKLFEQLDRFEDSTAAAAAIELPESETISDLEKVVEKLQKSQPVVTKNLKVSGEDKKTVENSFSRSNSWRLDSCSSFGSYGSMRKEKEWKRTLACKLFEERHNSEGGEEGMDSLWECYEDENNSSRKSKNRNKSTVDKKKKNSSEFKCFEEDDDDEDEFMSNGQLCCLKALKLSTGKMSLGMGKPNLVKISKALKGFGWLHHVGNKHGKRN